MMKKKILLPILAIAVMAVMVLSITLATAGIATKRHSRSICG